MQWRSRRELGRYLVSKLSDKCGPLANCSENYRIKLSIILWVNAVIVIDQGTFYANF